MKKSVVLAHFGTLTAVAKALGISLPSVSAWGEVVPELRAWQLERYTLGALRVEAELYEKPLILTKLENLRGGIELPDRHADCADECQTAAARGPVYRCDHRRCDLLPIDHPPPAPSPAPGAD